MRDNLWAHAVWIGKMRAGQPFAFTVAITVASVLCIVVGVCAQESSSVKVRAPIRARLVDSDPTATPAKTEQNPPSATQSAPLKKPTQAKRRLTDAATSPPSSPNAEPVEPQALVEPDETATPTAASRRKPAPAAVMEEPEPLISVQGKAAEDGGDDIAPGSFQDITPGETTLAEVREALGEPKSEAKRPNGAKLIYQLGPFPKVEISSVDDMVGSITIHLETPAAINDVAAELELGRFTPVTVTDENGRSLGRTYPERAITLKYAEGEKERRLVSHIVLDQISDELFVLRAENDPQHRFTQNLKDVETALRLNPDNARACWLKAKLLSAIGRPRKGLEAIHVAVEREPDNASYKLLRNRLLYEAGQYVKAEEEMKLAVRDKNQPPQCQALAEQQYGDLLAWGPTRDFKEAMSHHMAAIKLAGPLAHDERVAVRRAAKEVLVASHLAVANDIAWGNWRGKSDTVPKWLAIAETLATDLVEHDHGHPCLRLRVHHESLMALAGCGESVTPSIEKAIDSGREMIAGAADPLHRHQLEWELGETLFHATRVAQLGGDAEEALDLANNALALLEPNETHRETTPASTYLMGRLFFAIGSLHAIGKQDHAEAVNWYAKAEEQFANPLPDGDIAEAGQQGERLVSMGVSYWKTGKKDHAIQLTKQGAQLVQRAIKSGTTHEEALAIPYSNLAAMHRELGNAEESQSFAILAKKAQTTSSGTKQR